VLDAQFEQIECRVDHDLHGQPRLGGTVGDTKCCLMKDNVGRLHQCRHELAIADIAMDHTHGTARGGASKIFRSSPHHVIERNDFDAAFVAQQVDDMRADKAGPSGDQNAPTFQISQDALLLLGLGKQTCICFDRDALGSLDKYRLQLGHDLCRLVQPQFRIDR
jgi:hypothetical protein